MEVPAFRPAAASRYLREMDGDERYRHDSLVDRARAACEQARETVAHSRELAWLLGEWMAQPITSRCAWCRRYHVGDRWVDPLWAPPIPTTRTTHSICDDCTQALRASGLSK